jgi:pimeloyl-ACP methyl ester carboxylesterase
MFRAALLGLLAVSLSLAQDATGLWKGAIQLPGTGLAVSVALSQQKGAWQGTIDIPAQGVREMPLTGVTVDGRDVRFSMQIPGNPAFNASISEDNSWMGGMFSQNGATFPFRLEKTANEAPAAEQVSVGVPGEGFAGIWLGDLVTPGGKLRLLVRLNDVGGNLSGTVDSVDQGARGLQITSVTTEGAHIRFELTRPAAAFEGERNADGSEIAGKWMQNGGQLPLVLRRQAGEPAASRRPQDPQRPYPYRDEEVAYRNEAASIELAGTLTIPSGEAPFPAVLLLTGSGPQDRDESIAGHRPFLVLADYLTRRGIAVLRVDDRGVGGSTGDVAASTTADFAADALAGVRYLQARPDFRRIGLIGHSEGALAAAMAASTSDAVAFVVLLGGPGLTGEKIVESQIRLLARAADATEESIEENLAMQRRIVQVLKDETDDDAARDKIRELLADAPPEAVEAAAASVGPWSRFFFSYDPLPALAKARVPVLALWGEHDMQVPPAENMPPIQQALEQAGRTDFSLKVLDGLNHLFQTSDSGLPIEYGQIEETFAPVALGEIADWILAHRS